MAREERSALHGALWSVLSPQAVEEAARRLGVVKRQRKVQVGVFVAVVVLSFQVGANRTLEGLRHAYAQVTGVRLSRSSFYARWTPQLAKLLRERVGQVLATAAPVAGLPSGPLSQFRELLALDATVVRLHALLAKTWPSGQPRHARAGLKLHVVANVFDGGASKIKLTSERVHDAAPWRRVEDWVRGCLLLFDLGYYRFHLFDRIDAHGGFFLTRAKTTFNPRITAVHRVWRGQSVTVVGQRLRDVLPRLERTILDVDAEVEFDKRAYKGLIGRRRRTFRIVALRNEQTGEYHVYLTNVPADRLPAEDVRATYALRWQVELLFKALKTHGRLDQLPSVNPVVVECLVWASILATLASHALYREIRRAVSKHRHLPLLRWAALFARFAPELLSLLLSPTDPLREQRLWRLLRREAPDPNRHRRRRAFQQVPVEAAA